MLTFVYIMCTIINVIVHLTFFWGADRGMSRKTVQVKPHVHERLEEFWRKIRFGFDYDRSSSGVIEYLMDFYDRHSSPEMQLALDLIKTVEARLNPPQVDIYEAIKRAQQVTK